MNSALQPESATSVMNFADVNVKLWSSVTVKRYTCQTCFGLFETPQIFETHLMNFQKQIYFVNT